MIQAPKTHPALRSQAMGLVDCDERKEQTTQLLDEFLPHMAAEIENIMHDQQAKVTYELAVEDSIALIRTSLKLKKLSHNSVILLNSKKATFILGTEIGGQHAGTALQATQLLKVAMLKFKAE